MIFALSMFLSFVAVAVLCYKVFELSFWVSFAIGWVVCIILSELAIRPYIRHVIFAIFAILQSAVITPLVIGGIQTTLFKDADANLIENVPVMAGGFVIIAFISYFTNKRTAETAKVFGAQDYINKKLLGRLRKEYNAQEKEKKKREKEITKERNKGEVIHHADLDAQETNWDRL